MKLPDLSSLANHLTLENGKYLWGGYFVVCTVAGGLVSTWNYLQSSDKNRSLVNEMDSYTIAVMRGTTTGMWAGITPWTSVPVLVTKTYRAYSSRDKRE